MRFYLSSPGNQLQAHAANDMPVLLSFATWSPWLANYQQSFPHILIDSGAFSELNSGKVISVDAYTEWSLQWLGRADAIAGLDSISGDWRQSLKNYAATPWSFPTMHDTDPMELLDELIAISLERETWLGIGLQPPRRGKEHFLRTVLDRVPDSIHVHGWALGSYAHLRGFDSMDSTNWFRDAMKYRSKMPWLTYGEALDIVIKRYQRISRLLGGAASESVAACP